MVLHIIEHSFANGNENVKNVYIGKVVESSTKYNTNMTVWLRHKHFSTLKDTMSD